MPQKIQTGKIYKLSEIDGKIQLSNSTKPNSPILLEKNKKYPLDLKEGQGKCFSPEQENCLVIELEDDPILKDKPIIKVTSTDDKGKKIDNGGIKISALIPKKNNDSEKIEYLPQDLIDLFPQDGQNAPNNQYALKVVHLEEGSIKICLYKKKGSTGNINVLSIDGGGIRGIIPAMVLEKMEGDFSGQAGQKHSVLSDKFDLMAGTSTGAILVLGLSLKKAGALVKIYKCRGPEIFPKSDGSSRQIMRKIKEQIMRPIVGAIIALIFGLIIAPATGPIVGGIIGGLIVGLIFELRKRLIGVMGTLTLGLILGTIIARIEPIVGAIITLISAITLGIIIGIIIQLIRGIFKAKYPHDNLERILKDDYFGGNKLLNAKTNTMVAAYDINNRKPFFFKSWKKECENVLMREAIRASGAAPTYFAPAQVEVQERRKDLYIPKSIDMIDGGVFMNNPALSAYAQAKRLFPAENVTLVSIGTGVITRPLDYESLRPWGIIKWFYSRKNGKTTYPLISSMLDGVNDAVDYQMRAFTENNPDDKYFRLQSELTNGAQDDIDNISKKNINELIRTASDIINQDHESGKNILDEISDSL